MVRFLPRPRFAALALTALLVTTTGCALPEGDRTSPEGVHYAGLSARLDADIEALWELMHPDVRSRFDRWVLAERRAMSQIELLYPDADRAGALAALGNKDRVGLEDGLSLFEHMVGELPERNLDVWETLGARVRSVALDGASATVRTWAGDEILARRLDDGSWTLVPTTRELEQLELSMARAEANLDQVKRNIKALRGENAPAQPATHQ